MSPPSGVLVDTNILSYLLRGAPLGNYYERLRAGRVAYVACATPEELYFGAEKKKWGPRKRRDLDGGAAHARARGRSFSSRRCAVALWNLGCYRALLGNGASVGAVIGALDEALRYAPQFRESLSSGMLDEDLASLAANPVFEEWRRATLGRDRSVR